MSEKTPKKGDDYYDELYKGDNDSRGLDGSEYDDE